MKNNLFNLAHIEITVPNVKNAYNLLHRTLGAEKVQKELADFISSDSNNVLHVGLGDTVFQFIEPKNKIFKAANTESSWYKQLKSTGPGVHNLAFNVKKIDKILETLDIELGINPLFSFDVKWEKLIHKDYINPTAKTVYMINSMDILGFHLELGEFPLNSRTLMPKTKYITGSDELIGNASTMLYIQLVTSDLAKSKNTLKQIHNSNTSNLSSDDFLIPDFMNTTSIKFKNVLLNYCKPTKKTDSSMYSWYDLLEKKGPSIHSIAFSVDNLNNVIDKFKKEGILPVLKFDLEKKDLLSKINSPNMPAYIMDTISQIGFYLELREKKL